MKKKTCKRISVLLALVMVLGLFQGFDIGGLFGGLQAQAATNAGQAFQGQDSDIFTALGFDTTALPNGFDPDTTENPYGREKSPFAVVYEVLLANHLGYRVFGNNNNSVGYDAISFSSRNSTSMPINAEMSAGAVGDFDGDGLMGEVAYVAFDNLSVDDTDSSMLYLYIFDAKTGRYSSSALPIGRTTPAWTHDGSKQQHIAHNWQNLLQIATGDFDGCGKSEIAVYVGDKTTGARVDIYKYQERSNAGADDWLNTGNWGRVWSYAVSAAGANVPNMVSLCAGDFNRDGVDDLAIAHGSAVYKYNDSPIGNSYTHLMSVASSARMLWGSSTGMLQRNEAIDLSGDKLGPQIRVSFTAGDIDSDGNKELVMTGHPAGETNPHNQTQHSRTVAVYAYDGTRLTMTAGETVKLVDGSWETVEIPDDTTSTHWTSANGFGAFMSSMPVMRTNSAVFKPSGMDTDKANVYIYVDSAILGYKEGQFSLLYRLDDEHYDGNDSTERLRWGGTRVDNQILTTRIDSVDKRHLNIMGYGEYNALSGDINGNGADILNVSFMREALFDGDSLAYSFSTLAGIGAGLLNWTGFSLNSTPLRGSQPAITMPDMDTDSYILEYTGVHYLTYSDPKVLAIIAAAPYYEDVDTIYESDYSYAVWNSTSYSQINGSGHSNIISVDFRFGGYLDKEFTAGAGKIEWGLGLGFTYNYDHNVTKSTEYTLTFSTVGDEDAVAFYCIPTENYVFLRHEPRGDGTYLTTTHIESNPFTPVYQVLNLDYYESIQGNYDELPPIRGSAIHSTPGAPATYPRSASAYDVVAQWDRAPAGVSFGNGSITQDITITREETTTHKFGGYFEFKFGGGFDAQADVAQWRQGLKGGIALSINPSGGYADIDLTGASYSGTVSNMPREFQDYGYYYNWKLFVYKYKFGDDTTIPVVSYLVGDVSQPPNLPKDFKQDYERSSSDTNVLTWSYTEAVSKFYIYKYFDFPVGGGLQLIATIDPGDSRYFEMKRDAQGRLYKEFVYTDANLSPYTEYKYAIQVERASPMPPLSAPSALLTVRTKALVGNPVLRITESDGTDDGLLHVFPDKTSHLTVLATGPDGEQVSNYYTTVQYQWQKQEKGAWVDLINEKSMTLTLAGAGVDTAGTYRCLVNVLVKANAQYISAYTETVELTHSKRTSYFDDLYVNDAPGGGLEFFARVRNAHADSAAIPSGFVSFNLISNLTGETFQVSVKLDASGVASEIFDGQLPPGMYTVNAYYTGSFIFTASSGTALYLSQQGSGYNIDAPNSRVYGYGAFIDFQKVTKANGVTSVENSNASSISLSEADPVFYGAYALPAGGSGQPADLPDDGQVVAGTVYSFPDVEGFDRWFLASRTGVVDVETANGFAVYGDMDESLLRATGDIGRYRLAENTPAGSYLVTMAADNVKYYKPIEVSHRPVTLQLPTLVISEVDPQPGEDDEIDNPKLGALQVLSGSWAICDLTGGDLLDAALSSIVVPVEYYNTAGALFDNKTVNNMTGFYTAVYPVSTKIDDMNLNYEITFIDGSVSVLGAVNELHVAARWYENLAVGTVAVISPELGYTNREMQHTDHLLQRHQAGTRVVLYAVPDPGYQVYDWYINGVAQYNRSSSLAHVMFAENTTIEVQFEIQRNTLHFGIIGDEGSGTLTCDDGWLTSGSILLSNSKLKFEAKANTGYHFKEWRYTQVGMGTIYDDTEHGDMASTFDFIMPTASCSVYAVFERDSYTLTFADKNGNDGLVAWYHARLSDSTALTEKVYVQSGERIMGDSEVTIEAAIGCALEPGYNFVSVGSQGKADYTAGTYRFNITEDTFVSGWAKRLLFDATFSFDVVRTSDEPVSANIVVSIAGEEHTYAYDESGPPTQSATVSGIPGGSPVSVAVSYPGYYDLGGWIHDGTCLIDADKDRIPAANELVQGGTVVKGEAYFYSYSVPDEGGIGTKTLIWYFTATATGAAAFSGDDGSTVTITMPTGGYTVDELDDDAVFTVVLREKPIYEVEMADIEDRGTYVYEGTLPEGAFVSKNFDDAAGGIITVHRGDDLRVSIDPAQRWTVSHWETTVKGVAYTMRATSLTYTIPDITDDYIFRPVFARTTYNTISWPTISSAQNSLTLSTMPGYLSSVATGNDFEFRLDGPSLSMLGKVYANGHEFTEKTADNPGNTVGSSIYSYKDVSGVRVYSIENVMENHVITLDFNEIGVTVGGVDISRFSGSGWNYNPGTQVLTLTNPGLRVSGANHQGFAPKLTINLAQNAGTVTFDNLNLATTATTAVSSTRSDGITISAVGSSVITIIRYSTIGLEALYGVDSANGVVIRGNGRLSIVVNTRYNNTYRATGINSANGDVLITGNIDLSVEVGESTLDSRGISAVTVQIGAAAGNLEPSLRILMNDGLGGRIASSIGLVANECNVYSGSLIVESSNIGVYTGYLDNYGGVMDLYGKESAILLDAGITEHTLKNFPTYGFGWARAEPEWRVHFENGYQLRYLNRADGSAYTTMIVGSGEYEADERWIVSVNNLPVKWNWVKGIPYLPGWATNYCYNEPITDPEYDEPAWRLLNKSGFELDDAAHIRISALDKTDATETSIRLTVADLASPSSIVFESDVMAEINVERVFYGYETDPAANGKVCILTESAIIDKYFYDMEPGVTSSLPYRIFAISEDSEIILGEYALELKKHAGLLPDLQYPEIIIKELTGTTYDFTVSGGIGAAEELVLVATSSSINKLTLRGFTFPRLTTGSAQITLEGNNYLIGRTGSPLTVLSDRLLIDGGAKGEGTLTLAAEGSSTSLTPALDHSAGILNIELSEVKAFTLFSDDAAISGQYTVSYHDRNGVRGTYNSAWRIDRGNYAVAAFAVTPAEFETQAPNAAYLKFYTVTSDATSSPSSLLYDNNPDGAEIQCAAELTFPAVRGRIHVFDISDQSCKVELRGANGTLISTLVESSAVVEPEKDADYTLTRIGNNDNGTLTLTPGLLGSLDNGAYTLRVYFYDDDPADATYYTLDIPLRIINSATSRGSLDISPTSPNLGRNRSVTFTTEYTGTTPAVYVWVMSGNSAGTTLEANGSTAVLTIGADEIIGSEIVVAVSSYLTENTSGEPEGHATATSLVTASAIGLDVTCASERPSGDGSFMLYHNLDPAGEWDFSALVRLDDGTTADNVTWSLWGAIRTATVVNPDTGILAVYPDETGSVRAAGERQRLELTATYTNADGSKYSRMVAIYLSSDASVTFTEDGINNTEGSIIAASHGDPPTAILPTGSWIPAGSTVTFTAQPDSGYEVKAWYVNGLNVSNDSFYTIVGQNRLEFTAAAYKRYHVSVEFITEENYTVVYEADGRGAVSAVSGGLPYVSGVSILKGGNVTITATPDEHCLISQWLVNGNVYEEPEGAAYQGDTLSLTGISIDYAIEVVFVEKPVDVTFIAEGRGTLTLIVNGEMQDMQDMQTIAVLVSGSLTTYSVTLKAYDDILIYASPETGFRVAGWELLQDAVFTPVPNSTGVATWEARSINGDIGVKATFGPLPVHTVTVSANSYQNGGGSVIFGVDTVRMSAQTSFEVTYGSQVSFEAAPEAGSYLYEWVVTGTRYEISASNGNVLTLIDVKSDATVTAVFRKVFYSVEMAQAANGELIAGYRSPDNSAGTITSIRQEVMSGSEVTIYAIPDDGYTLDTLTVNGVQVPTAFDSANNAYAYTIYGLREDILASATFAELGQPNTVTIRNDFEDVDGKAEGGAYIEVVNDGVSQVDDQDESKAEVAQFGTALITFTPADGYSVDITILLEEMNEIKANAGSNAAILAALSVESVVVTVSGVDMDLDFSGIQSPFVPLTGGFVTITITAPVNGTLSLSYFGAIVTSGAKVPIASELDLAATPGANYMLGELTANEVKVSTDVFTIVEDTDFSAVFVRSHYMLSVDIAGTGAGSLWLDTEGQPSRELKPADLPVYLPAGSALQLRAIAADGSVFEKLIVDGAVVSGPDTGNPAGLATITGLDSDVAIGVIFNVVNAKVTIVDPANGTLRVIRSDTMQDVIGSQTLPVGTTLIIVAGADAHYALDRITAGGTELSGTENTYIVSGSKDNVISAAFILDEVRVTWDPPVGGTISVQFVNGSQVAYGQYVKIGTELRIIAAANTDYELESISVNALLHNSGDRHTVNEDVRIIALFRYSRETPPGAPGPQGPAGPAGPSGPMGPMGPAANDETLIEEEDVALTELISLAPFIEGYPDGSFRPDNTMTREEFATLLYNIYNPDPLLRPVAGASSPTFNDVAPDRWSYNAIEWAVKAGYIMAEDDGCFRPGDPLTRAEMAAMFASAEKWTEKAENTFSDIDDHPYRDAILMGAYQGVFTGYPDGTFKPDDEITRLQVVVAVVRYLLGFDPTGEVVQSADVAFPDVPPSHWAYRYIAIAANGYTSPAPTEQAVAGTEQLNNP